MKHGKTRLTVPVLGALLLAACGTSPPSNFYTLSPADIPYAPDKVGSTILGIGPIRVPEYLERPQMVTRRANQRLKVDEFNRWAEPIGDVQYRIIAENVDALLDDVVAIAYPYGGLADYDYRLVARVSRFDMDLYGNTMLDVHWGISSTDGSHVVPATRSEYTASSGDPDNPGSVATAMNGVLEQFSRDIASRFGDWLATSNAAASAADD